MSFLSYPICALFIIILVNIAFFSRRSVNTFETKNYGKLIFVNLIETVFALVGLICIKFSGDNFFSQLLVKIDYVFLLTWGSLLFRYVISIAIKDEQKIIRINNIISICNAIISIFILILPVEVLFVANSIDSEGLSTSVLFISIFICLLGIIVFVFKIIFSNDSKDKKKLIPLLSLLILIIILVIIKTFIPEMIIQGFALSFVSLIMYFTIENPDVKMITQLSIAKETAEKANRAKSDFLSSMSHEIRTPLNAIVGLSQDIINYDIPEDALEDANDIINASNTLLEIVGNILDINKIESEKMEIVLKPYDFREEVESLIKVTSTRIADKPIEFSYHIAEDIPGELIGDKVHIKAIVNNLLTNAIKYTDSGKITVNIKCINENDICNLFISVQDTGRGIKAEDINKLFTKFERLDIEKNSTTEGTGLGLAITKRLVEMMNGKINVQSTYREGSLFVVTIPQKINRKEVLTNTQIISTKNVLLALREEYKGKKILIVDDNKLNIKVAKKALDDFDFFIDEVYDGEECLKKVRDGNIYDLILMDIMMPKMSGRSALQELKKMENFDTPVIALTADALADSENKYIAEGFVDYIAKPFNREQIAEKLDKIFINRK